MSAKFSEKTIAHFLLRSLLASLGGAIAIILVYSLLNPAINFIISGEFPIGGLEPFAYSFWCCCDFGFLAFCVFPLSFIGELLLVRKFRLKWWLHVPVMAIIFGVVIFIFVTVFSLALFAEYPDPAATLLVIVDDDIMAISYWLILRVLDRIIKI
jgi:hypothetical protein